MYLAGALAIGVLAIEVLLLSCDQKKSGVGRCPAVRQTGRGSPLPREAAPAQCEQVISLWF